MSLWTPADIPTSLWLDAGDDTTVTTSSGIITQWRDKSGNARHAATSDTSRRPSYVIGYLNGLNVAYFGGNHSISGVLPLTMVQESVFAVFRYASSSEIYARIFTQSDASYDYQTAGKYIPMARPNTNGFGSETSSGFGATRTIAYDTFSLFDSVHSGSMVTNRLNGEAAGATLAHVLNKAWTRYRLGGSLVANEYSDSLLGYIAEVIVLNYTASTDLRQIIEGYLAWKWGLFASLPEDHRYRTIAPAFFNLSGNVMVSAAPAQRDVLIYKNKDTSLYTSTQSDPTTGDWSVAVPGNSNDKYRILIVGETGEFSRVFEDVSAGQ